MSAMDDGWRDLPLGAMQRLFRYSFEELNGYHELTSREQECITADEYAVLEAWSRAEPCGDRGKCSSCGVVNTAQVRL